MTERLRVVVCGYVVRGPLGGLAWHHLQYVLGLARLGHDVLFMEDSEDYPACYDPETHALSTDPSYGLGFAADAFQRTGLPDAWAYYDAHGDRWLGPLGDRAPVLAAQADVLLNVSGVNPPRGWWQGIPRRVLLDTDPAFTQIRHLEDSAALAAVRSSHTSFLTFAGNIRRGSLVPDDGLAWEPTRQPVVLDAWPLVPGDPHASWTTVMQWDSYAEREHRGVVYGMKSRSFGPYLRLPARVPGERLALAVGSPSAPRDQLRAAGWEVLDPLAATRDPWTFRGFVQRSKGEFAVAKEGYVVSRSGWFSERSANYLASGRPAVLEDSGFSSWLPCGTGLLAFRNPEEAADALEEVSADYERHCRAARDLAVAHFDARDVLNEILDSVAGSPR